MGIVVDDWLEPHEPSVAPEEGPLDIAYEDEDLLVVNKPAGAVVHPCPSHWTHTLGNYVVGYLMQKRQAIDLHAVNRLDIGTSGLVVFAKNGHVQERLMSQMHTGSFQREYLAVCHGVPEPAHGMIDTPIGRATAAPVSSFAVMESGKKAVTHYEVLEQLGSGGGNAPTTALVRLALETGRTHQIRVHMAHMGHPLVGDVLYGGSAELLDRPALHSWKLDLVQPVTGTEIHLTAAPPQDLVELLDALHRS